MASIVHWRNKGGLFGLHVAGCVRPLLFLVIPLAVIAGLAYYLVAYRLPFWTRLSLTLVLSGAVGNIYDRISLGYVIDFIVVHYKNYQYPAFNVADSAITFGIGLWFFTQFFLKEGARRTGQRSSS